MKALDRAKPIVFQPQCRVEPAQPVGLRPQSCLLERHDGALNVTEHPLRGTVVETDVLDARRSDDIAKRRDFDTAFRRAGLHQFELPTHPMLPTRPIDRLST
ncbi:hypothetical protein [Thalassobaculum sp.]|uniref:hypothetical protein n=1 Tax=Thalassobaculum sp. TaxID=2022740 RepID=UPI0032EF44C1